MKLIDILARELKEWPEGAVSAVQDSDKVQTIKFAGDGHTEIRRGAGDIHAKNVWRADRWRFGSARDFNCCYLAEDHDTAIVTRAEWQSAVDALNKPADPAWDGQGLPPVGTVCEFKANILGWVEATITAVTELSIVFTRPSFQNGRPLVEERLPHKAIERFRPILTPEQIAAEEREKAIDAMAEDLRAGFANPKIAARTLYDAGYRKQEAP